MSNITKIEGSSCQRYSNALHVGFHQHILVIFETLLSDVLAKLHISVDLLNSYKKSIDQESELNRKSFARTLYFQCCYKSRKYFTISNLFYTKIFLFAGCPIEQLMAQMNTDTTRYITIEGLVRDQNDRKRLEFVHVTVPGTPIGTVTNSEGVFSIKIKRSLQARQILFTHVGYKNQRIPIDSLDQSGLKIYLTPTTQQLSDLIVRGGDARFIVEEARRLQDSIYTEGHRARPRTSTEREKTAEPETRRYISGQAVGRPHTTGVCRYS